MIYLAPSIWRSMDVRTATAVYASIGSNPTAEPVIWEPLWNDALIARSRSLLATKFLEEEHMRDADVMVVVDDDVVWQPEDFWKIVEGCRETRSIYGGAYVTRSDKPHLSSRVLPNSHIEFKQTPQRRPIEIEYLATGFWAVHRDVFEAMVGHRFDDADGGHEVRRVSLGADREFWPFFATFTIEHEPGKFHYLSEDWAFCERARQLGFKVWMDQSIVLQHMGWYPFTVGDLGGMHTNLPSTGTDVVEIEGRDRATGEPLLDTLVEYIAEFAEETPGDIRRMLGSGTETMARLWGEKPEGQSEADFYQREDVGLAYILDLANWHIAGFGPRNSVLDGLAGKTVLDWGSGIGTTALKAARAGASVWCFEPNETMREFADFRARKHGLMLNDYSVRGGPALFDAVVCWHVFEHVEDAEATLATITRRLKDGALLITESDFCADDGHPMHHVRDDWEDVLAAHGFAQESHGVYRFTFVREAVLA